MGGKYWLDLFTAETWNEFLKNGAEISGFRESKKKLAEKIKPGDYFICYVTGISRFIGILEIKSKVFCDNSQIWERETFPIRFKVKLVHKLTLLTAIPVLELKDKLSIFKNLKSKNAWTGSFRGSPARIKEEDGEIIAHEIKKAEQNPVSRDYDKKKLLYRPRTYESKFGTVTIPENENERSEELAQKKNNFSQHDEIQYLLIKLGSEMGLDVWIARNDRNKAFNGISFQSIGNIKKELPRQFDDATNTIIEMIDVLWMRDNAIIAAFEIENTTTIYSGLLRMSDLISMQPNIDIKLYLVAPDERKDKVKDEINRPTFSRLKKPLKKICKFLSYSQLKTEMATIGDRIKYMKPEFIDEIADDCELEDL